MASSRIAAADTKRAFPAYADMGFDEDVASRGLCRCARGWRLVHPDNDRYPNDGCSPSNTHRCPDNDRYRYSDVNNTDRQRARIIHATPALLLTRPQDRHIVRLCERGLRLSGHRQSCPLADSSALSCKYLLGRAGLGPGTNGVTPHRSRRSHAVEHPFHNGNNLRGFNRRPALELVHQPNHRVPAMLPPGIRASPDDVHAVDDPPHKNRRYGLLRARVPPRCRAP